MEELTIARRGGSGKTTLLNIVTGAVAAHGYKVTSVKHNEHELTIVPQ
jgi:molybdopterin-guanine dinucleotide biosynthesis protein MobB